MRERTAVFAFSILFISLALLCGPVTQTSSADLLPPTINVLTQPSPAPNETINNPMPLVMVIFYDADSINWDTFEMKLDGAYVNGTKGFYHEAFSVFYNVSKPLSNGRHQINITVSDTVRNEASFGWRFYVNYTAPFEHKTDYQRIFINVIVTIGLFLIIALVFVVVFVVYLYNTKGFSFRKLFLRRPHLKDWLGYIIPFLAAIFVFITGYFYIKVFSSGPFAYEYLFLSCFFIAFGWMALMAQREKSRKAKYEKAFSQVLFELADALRGGLDPAKGIIEISTNNSGVLRKELKIAAKNIKIGRSFEEVLMNLAEPTRSDLVDRYASLIAEAYKIGGDISVVVHRAAKDMDDIIKINEDRSRRLRMNVGTLYLSLAILLVIIVQLVRMYPYFSDIDMSSLMNIGLPNSNAPPPPPIEKMSFVTLKRKFFHVCLANAIGSGLLIGVITDGKVKYGIIHALVMTLVVLGVFFIFVF